MSLGSLKTQDRAPNKFKTSKKDVHEEKNDIWERKKTTKC